MVRHINPHRTPTPSSDLRLHFRLAVAGQAASSQHSYFSLITTVGTPQCITAQELRVECMFPTDVEERAL
jgi:hypothetical protein